MRQSSARRSFLLDRTLLGLSTFSNISIAVCRAEYGSHSRQVSRGAHSFGIATSNTSACPVARYAGLEVAERAFAGEDHCDPVPVTAFNQFSVLDGAAGLDYR